MAALDTAYQDLAREEAVCRPRIDIQIPTKDPEKIYQWRIMEGGSTSGYFAIPRARLRGSEFDQENMPLFR